MPQGARNMLFLVGLAAVVGLLAYGLSRRSTGPRDALAMAPAGTVAVAELDVPGVRGSSLFRELTAQETGGLREIERTCGFDPLDQLRTVHVFLLREPGQPADAPGASLGEVAFLGRGALDHEALVRCVGDVVASDGGGVHETTIEGAAALASDHGSSVVAWYGRDGVVAGADVVVAELLRIGDGASPSMPRDENLVRLWRRAATRAHVRLVARLPRNWQRFLGRLAELTEALEPLGGASALGLGATLDAGDSGDGIALTIALDLGTRGEARSCLDGLEQRLAAARADPELAGTALDVVLAHVSLDAEGRDLVARAELDRAELDATVALIRRTLAERETAERDPGVP